MKKLIASAIVFCTLNTFAQTQPNIIFIMLDDLNDYVEDFNGHPQVQTPNLTEIGNAGTVFYNNYCSAPGCGPSRTSLLSGKDIDYTQVYNNNDYASNFRGNFNVAKNNAEVFSLPEILKDTGGYYTYAINKIFHSEEENDFDNSATAACSKSQSWNRLTVLEESEEFTDLSFNYQFAPMLDWGVLPDSLEQYMEDNMAADSAVAFINQVSAGTANTCGKPFFLAVGFHRPHPGRFIPEQYYSDYYMDDYYEEPFTKPFNEPYNAFPNNGIIMPPQPADSAFADYYALPYKGVAQAMADAGVVHMIVSNLVDTLDPLPEIDPLLTDAERREILKQSIFADYVMSYLAAAKFVDAQVGRVYDALQSDPDLLNNTIVVVFSDNGFSLGEKRHWTKWSMWETDLRVPFIITAPGFTGNRVCYKNTSLLDVFPTVCDLVDVPYPKFSDGSDYLDGRSLMPLFTNVNTMWEEPVLSTLKRPNGQGKCFSHYSVRSDRFHYIKYKPNNDGTVGTNVCMPSADTIQQELYDIGINRETDPNEWNNLVYDPDYTPVINYLQQFLPDSAMYMQQPLEAQITNGNIACLLNNTAVLKLKAKVYNTNGTLLAGASLSAYTLRWSNNITSATATGSNYNFNMATIPAATYSAGSEIIFYLKVTENATGKLVAFDTKTYYFNAANTPVISFNKSVSGTTVSIIDYNITGTYTNTNWTFGDGYSTEDFLPAPHTYAGSGTYSIKNFAYYGNKPTCKITKSKSVTIASPPMRLAEEVFDFSIYPNPAQDVIEITFTTSAANANMMMFNELGQIVLQQRIEDMHNNKISVNIHYLPAGIYYIRIGNENNTATQKFEVY
ncbi:MAG: sulfatase-like hydrolase/transferase [Fimbriimonadaceae bacterium]|nr:sulfatase-like hydrolase/transferase [Chitinophagales bacterium]